MNKINQKSSSAVKLIQSSTLIRIKSPWTLREIAWWKHRISAWNSSSQISLLLFVADSFIIYGNFYDIYGEIDLVNWSHLDSPGWEGSPAPAVQDIPEEAEELRTAADGNPGQEEPRTAAGSKSAGDMPGYQELQLEVGLLPRSSGGSFGCSHQVPLEERFQGIPLVLHRGNLK